MVADGTATTERGSCSFFIFKYFHRAYPKHNTALRQTQNTLEQAKMTNDASQSTIHNFT